jgi:REP element-mobilizing transposase RayT
MKYDPDKHARRSIRLRGYEYTQSGAYFVTICIHQRECLLGDVINGDMVRNKCGDIVQECWNELPAHFPKMGLDTFVVMPNHVHGIILLRGGAASSAPTLWDIVRAFKSLSAIRINRFLDRCGRPLWQRNYYEHIIRHEEALNRAREYIVLNPLRWHLDQENPKNRT